MSELILQPFCCFTYVTVHSPTLLSLLLRYVLKEGSFRDRASNPSPRAAVARCKDHNGQERHCTTILQKATSATKYQGKFRYELIASSLVGIKQD